MFGVSFPWDNWLFNMQPFFFSFLQHQISNQRIISACLVFSSHVCHKTFTGDDWGWPSVNSIFYVFASLYQTLYGILIIRFSFCITRLTQDSYEEWTRVSILQFSIYHFSFNTLNFVAGNRCTLINLHVQNRVVTGITWVSIRQLSI